MELAVVWLVSLATLGNCICLTHNSLAAIAANLALDMPIARAVKMGCRYVEAGIRHSRDIGHGNGPINHFHSSSMLPFAP